MFAPDVDAAAHPHHHLPHPHPHIPHHFSSSIAITSRSQNHGLIRPWPEPANESLSYSLGPSPKLTRASRVPQLQSNAGTISLDGVSYYCRSARWPSILSFVLDIPIGNPPKNSLSLMDDAPLIKTRYWQSRGVHLFLGCGMAKLREEFIVLLLCWIQQRLFTLSSSNQKLSNLYFVLHDLLRQISQKCTS